MHQVLNFIVSTITTTKSPNDADIKSTKLHISLLRGICSQFMVGRYTISAQCTLFTQVVHIPNRFKVLQGLLQLIHDEPVKIISLTPRAKLLKLRSFLPF